ncbi:MAG: hypothetical protein ACRD19_02140 [Terriglobia bacterium]
MRPNLLLALASFLLMTSAAQAQGVTSLSGDGTLINNTGSTGAVDLTLGNAGAYTLWGNNTSSSAAPGYQTSPQVSGTMTAGTFVATGGRSNLSANSELYALGIYYKPSDGPAYIGATDSSTPDMVFSNAAGSSILQLKYSRVVELNGYGAGILSTDSSGNISAGTSIALDSPTGGSQGAGTINVSGGYYLNGALMPNGIFSGGQLLCGGSLPPCHSSTLSYCPYKGNLKTTAKYGTYTIPSGTAASGCLTANLTSMYVGGTAAQSASASTLYYVYLINVSGTTYLDLETTGHATDSTTGIEIESGDNTKTLVGMIHTDSSTKVATQGNVTVSGDTNTVATWDNRQPTTTVCIFTQVRTLTNPVNFTEINPENRCFFMSWGDGAAIMSNQEGSNNTAGNANEGVICIDGTKCLDVYLAQTTTANYYTQQFAPSRNVTPTELTEGYHYTSLKADLTGTASYNIGERTSVLTVP